MSVTAIIHKPAVIATLVCSCALISLPAVVWFWGGFFSNVVKAPPALTFDSAGWRKNWDSTHSDIRERMAYDIERNHRLNGMTRDRVIALLGQEGGCHIEQAKGSVTYDLGGFMLDTLWLTVEFKNGRFDKCYTWVD